MSELSYAMHNLGKFAAAKTIQRYVRMRLEHDTMREAILSENIKALCKANSREHTNLYHYRAARTIQRFVRMNTVEMTLRKLVITARFHRLLFALQAREIKKENDRANAVAEELLKEEETRQQKSIHKRERNKNRRKKKAIEVRCALECRLCMASTATLQAKCCGKLILCAQCKPSYKSFCTSKLGYEALECLHCQAIFSLD